MDQLTGRQRPLLWAGMKWCILIALVAVLFFAGSARAEPNSKPPSVIPGPTNCDQANCKRRRVWRSRYHSLSRVDREWLRRTGDCETRGYARAASYRVNIGNGYFGRYQFSASTARAAGYTKLPHRTWRYEQDVRTLRWRNRSGAGQWPICG